MQPVLRGQGGESTAGAHLRYLLPSQPFREVSSREQYQVTAMPILHRTIIDIALTADAAGRQVSSAGCAAAAAAEMNDTEQHSRHKAAHSSQTTHSSQMRPPAQVRLANAKASGA